MSASPESDPHGVLQNGKTLCLVLSGGGLRAALYQLGILVHLRKTGRLGNVRQIVGISGGGILAAHLVQHWLRATSKEEEGFIEVASEFVRFARNNIRDRALIPWIWSRLLPWRWFSESSSRSSRLERIYSTHFGLTRMRDLKDGPCLALGSTRSAHLERVVFTSQHIYRFDIVSGKLRESIQSLYTPLALAVTASSCFPPVFAPVRVDHEKLGIDFELFRDELRLNDGGVTDNLGLAALVGLLSTGWALHETLVCDAERPLDGKGGLPDWKAREAEMRRRSLELAPVLDTKLTLLSLRTRVDSATPIDSILEIRLSKFRTDLDAPSWPEIRALMRHGASVASSRLDNASLESNSCASTIAAILSQAGADSQSLPPPGENDLAVSHIRPKMRLLVHIVSAIGIVLLSFGILGILACVICGPPRGAISRDQFEDRHRGFFKDSGLSRNLDYKAKDFRGLSPSPPISIKTIFFEGKPVGGEQGFVKLQLYEFPSSASGKVKIRAYSTDSTGAIANQVVLHRYLGAQFLPLPPSEIVEVVLRGNDEIVVIATYNQPLISKYKVSGSEEIWRDWHNVEVSDLAQRGGVRYFFATGRAGDSVTFVDRYEVGVDCRHNEWYLSRPQSSAQQISRDHVNRVISTSLRDAAIEGSKRFGSPHREAFELLGDPANLQLQNIAWAAEELKNAKYDIFYVIEPSPR